MPIWLHHLLRTYAPGLGVLVGVALTVVATDFAHKRELLVAWHDLAKVLVFLVLIGLMGFSGFRLVRELFLRVIHARCPQCGGKAATRAGSIEYVCSSCGHVVAAEFTGEQLWGGFACVGSGVFLIIFSIWATFRGEVDWSYALFMAFFATPFILSGLLVFDVPQRVAFLRATSDRVDWQQLIVGIIVLFIGTIGMVAMLSSSRDKFHVEPWIALLAGSCFPLVAVIVIYSSFKRSGDQSNNPVIHAIGALFVSAMAVVTWGIAITDKHILVGLGAVLVSGFALRQWSVFVKRLVSRKDGK